jgi:endogenous inhibitor of DNA gyrase (YacG/DUF329 family)
MEGLPVIRPLECPICRKCVAAPSEGIAKCFPFCSERCRQVDLLRWSKGKYAIVEPLPPDESGTDETEDSNG